VASGNLSAVSFRFPILLLRAPCPCLLTLGDSPPLIGFFLWAVWSSKSGLRIGGSTKSDYEVIPLGKGTLGGGSFAEVSPTL